mgnify:CR=1 FL=1|jgi:hypothetical protein
MTSRWLTLLQLLPAALPVSGSAHALKGELLSIGDGETIRAH